MKKTLLASAALALTLGMSGSVFAAPGNTPPGDPQGGPLTYELRTCLAGQAGVVVLGLRDQAKDADMTPGALVQMLKGDGGAGDFVQNSHSFCGIGSDEPQ